MHCEIWRAFVDSFALGTRMALEFPPENAVPTRDALTISELNRAVAGALARGFPRVRVRGEIGNLARAASGHWYFTLKDAVAQVRCAMFRNRNMLVDFSPREGDEVEVTAAVTLYEARGEFQLVVETLNRAGLGRRYEEFLRLKNRLAAEGLFDAARKRPVPAVPQRVGVVTSLAAAALRDVLTTLRRRAPYLQDIVVYPVPVQGEGAAAQIAAMLQKASQRADVDVLLLVRGGGSLEDLWAFNEEGVARALRACAVPVICGVGHESDITIADLAADVRAPTPTAAAELAALAAQDLAEAVSTARLHMRRRLRTQLQQAAQRLDYAQRALAAPRAALRGLRVRADALSARLCATAHGRLRVARTQLEASLRTLRGLVQQSLQARIAHVQAHAQALQHLDPHQVLARGYSLTRDAHGHVVRDATALTPGDALHTVFAQGVAVSVVQRVDAHETPTKT